MPTTSVIEQFDILEQVTSYVIYCIIIPSVNPLFLKCGEETLDAGIIIRASWSTHAARDSVLLQHLFIALTGVLCASFFHVTWHVFFLLFLPIWYHRKHWSLFHRTPHLCLCTLTTKKAPDKPSGATPPHSCTEAKSFVGGSPMLTSAQPSPAR